MSRLVGVGVGPGDPGLITLKAARLLERVPLVFHPPHGLARSIAAAHLNPSRQELVEVPFPLGDGEAAARLVLAHLDRVPEAAYLTEGDPLLFGSFATVAAAVRRLDPAAEVSVIPGVTSFSAAAARVGLPLAGGSRRIAVLTGGDPGLEAALRAYDTVVVLKAARGFEGTLAALDRAGRTPEAVLVRRCGLPEEEVVADVRAATVGDYFSLLLVTRP